MDASHGGSFLWGLVAGSSLLIGALVALRFRLGDRVIGLVLAFGAGVLTSAVAFDLVDEAFDIADGKGGLAFGLFAGCAVFFAGDVLIGRFSAKSGGEDSGPLAIVLGAVLDGIPESIVIGLTLFESGEIGVAYLCAVFLSNLPEGIAATGGLIEAGWTKSRVVVLWSGIALVSALSSLAGYTLLKDASQSTVAFVLAFAGGAVLTMLASEMTPEAHEKGGRLAGVFTTVGFALAYWLHVSF
jgi:ZIP family zinc transporter